jgi:hypothetical protein
MVATDRIFAYDEFGLGNVSEAFGNMDRELAAERNAKTPKVVNSRIRVLLSRPLTWAEKEDLETDNLDPHLRRIDGTDDDGFKVTVAPNFEHVWAEAAYGSRVLYEVIAAALEHKYVNVFPRAVRTFREYNGE